MTSWRLVAAWVMALAVATLLTWQIVSFADSRVGARPVEIASVASATSTTPTLATSTSAPSSSSTSETSPPSSSTTQTSDAEWSFRTVNTSGGKVVIRHRPEMVELEAATPAPGFDVEIDNPGPQRVRVEFESDTEDIRVEARWENGSLDVEISESG